MRLRVKIACVLSMLFAVPCTAAAGSGDDLYTASAIVTGTGEKNRLLGFRDCLDRVLIRVSGDQRVLDQPKMAELGAKPGAFVTSFSYRDRLAGKPVHDEQGTYDRPHDLTCRFRAETIDAILASLGSRPWLEPRPALAVSLDVKRGAMRYRLNRDDLRDQPMREAFTNAGALMAMKIVFPDRETAKTGPPPLGGMETGALPIQGMLEWSDPDLGWVATWHLQYEGLNHRWEARGVNFDEAFRVAVRGAARILSGHGAP